MSKKQRDDLFTSRTSLVVCPKCHSEVMEVWLTLTASGKQRRYPRFEGATCSNDRCRHNLAAVKQPIQEFAKA